MSLWDDFFLIYARSRDVHELRDAQRHFRRKSFERRREQSRLDQAQTERIEALEHENDDLKLGVCALLAVLQRRGHLEEAEVMEIVKPLLEPMRDSDAE
jgi:hypothetical protein